MSKFNKLRNLLLVQYFQPFQQVNQSYYLTNRMFNYFFLFPQVINKNEKQRKLDLEEYTSCQV